MTVITPEQIASKADARLTRYTVADAVEINTLAAELDSAHAEYEAISQDVFAAVLAAAPAERWIGWEAYLPESLAKAYELANDSFAISYGRGGHGNEAFPLSVWRQNAAKFRRQAKRIRKAIAAV